MHSLFTLFCMSRRHTTIASDFHAQGKEYHMYSEKG